MILGFAFLQSSKKCGAFFVLVRSLQNKLKRRAVAEIATALQTLKLKKGGSCCRQLPVLKSI
jgi:hypothetical protein